MCDPIDGSPPGSPIPGILQARTLEWVAISFSNAWKWKEKVKSLSRVWLLATPWTAAYQALPSTGFSRQEYWSGVPSPSPIHPPHMISYFLLWLYLQNACLIQLLLIIFTVSTLVKSTTIFPTGLLYLPTSVLYSLYSLLLPLTHSLLDRTATTHFTTLIR